MNKKLQQAMREEQPLQMVGTINAYSALLAKNAGFKAIYLSGAGVANHSLGLPDLAMTTLNDVCEDIRRISYSCDLPLIADADTGWGNAFMELSGVSFAIGTWKAARPLSLAKMRLERQTYWPCSIS